MDTKQIDLRLFSLEQRTPELCARAVARDWRQLGYVPVVLRTREIVSAALAQRRDALKFVVTF